MAKRNESSIDSVKFIATFPPTATAIQMHGDGGMRICLDISETEVGKALPVMKWRGVQMEVSIQEL